MKYTTFHNFGANCFYLAMNKRSFEKLPPDIQKIIEDISGEPLVRAYGVAADANHDEAFEILVAKAGHQIYTLPEDEDARWTEMVKPIAKKYIDDIEARGMPGKQIFEVMMAEMPIKIKLD